MASLGFLQQAAPVIPGFSVVEVKPFSSSSCLRGLGFLSLNTERDLVYPAKTTKNPFTISLVVEKQA